MWMKTILEKILCLTSVRVKDIGFVLSPPAVETAAHGAKSASLEKVLYLRLTFGRVPRQKR